ncbi:Dbl domain-containing protein [Moniliophthora roreri MCA 2997]|uniref:Dbl domain-containing protein n=1 Tax=Moniliophthora roreri (strain MCA 2997) TaxID=1381753 RepID=V2WDC0_MONRO|nr:Dbl domain-containing protein [Moniliophthora roreri MCA 2997]
MTQFWRAISKLQTDGRSSMARDIMCLEKQLRRIEVVFEDERAYRELLKQKGNLAQSLLDLLQLLIDFPGTPPHLRTSICSTMLRLSRKQLLHPRCLSIHNVSVIGRYPVAGGGFGDIWKGALGSQVVCLKVVKMYIMADVQQLLKEYLREVIVWRQLKHPNILPCLGLYYLDDNRERLCLVSPWMDNGNLVDFLKDRSCESIDRYLIMYDVANGLSYLHSLKIIHGDLKGVNILITPSRRACLADFGLSRVADSQVFKITSSSTHTTGTVRWLAPEVHRGMNTSLESDIYAYGCVCYETFTGLLPFHHLHNDAAVVYHVSQGSRPARHGDIEDIVWSLMQSCWSEDPQRRPTAEKLLQDLINIVPPGTVHAAPDWEEMSLAIWNNVKHPPLSEDVVNFLSGLEKRTLSSNDFCDVSDQDPGDFVIPLVSEDSESIHQDTRASLVLTQQKTELRRYASLICQTEQPICFIDDLDPFNDKRRLIHSGNLKCQSASSLSDFFVFLFDNYFLMTEVNESGGLARYRAVCKPTPLDMLSLGDFGLPPIEHGVVLFPFNLHRGGQIHRSYTLYAESAEIRAEWQQKFEEALSIPQTRDDVFAIKPMIPTVAGLQLARPSHVTCSVTFASDNGRVLIAIGCEDGVWIGFVDDPRSIRQVLCLKMVTQCLVLEQFAVLLVLADRVLLAYHVETLVSAVSYAAQTLLLPQRLSGNKDVYFFSAGRLHYRTLVVYMTKIGQDNICRVLEPVAEKIGKASTSLGHKFLHITKSEWFKRYKVSARAGRSAKSPVRDFFLPPGTLNLMFHDNSIIILCDDGFRIVNPNNFTSIAVPQVKPNSIWLAPLADRRKSCQSLGIFSSAADEFLLCYKDFGLYVDKSYNPRPTAAIIEWENTAERVALHRPYILLFSNDIIEIRQLETGKLAQVIRSNGMRCIWDGRGMELGRRMAAQDSGLHLLGEGSEGSDGAVLGIFAILAAK